MNTMEKTTMRPTVAIHTMIPIAVASGPIEHNLYAAIKWLSLAEVLALPQVSGAVEVQS
jgi:hypothetical protein